MPRASAWRVCKISIRFDIKIYSLNIYTSISYNFLYVDTFYPYFFHRFFPGIDLSRLGNAPNFCPAAILFWNGKWNDIKILSFFMYFGVLYPEIFYVPLCTTNPVTSIYGKIVFYVRKVIGRVLHRGTWAP